MFFFSSRRRHTRCGRDWSSDVCSSDLQPCPARGACTSGAARRNPPLLFKGGGLRSSLIRHYAAASHARSEERRVGKECRSRWWPSQLIKNTESTERDLK